MEFTVSMERDMQNSKDEAFLGNHSRTVISTGA
jgi:hypothetical protein